MRSKGTQIEVLLLCWVVPYFLVTGAFHVKFMRYMLPIAPLLTLFGARMLWALWDGAAVYRRSLRPVVGVLIALVVGATAFYALAYVNGVYGGVHTGVRASDWLNRNAPYGAYVLKEHWEESLPNLRSDFEFFDLPMYEDDRAGKTAVVADALADADYLVFFSNRLYGTIPRLPERYPVSTEYYRLLFSEQLGYTLADVQTSYPTLFGIGFRGRYAGASYAACSAQIAAARRCAAPAEPWLRRRELFGVRPSEGADFSEYGSAECGGDSAASEWQA